MAPSVRTKSVEFGSPPVATASRALEGQPDDVRAAATAEIRAALAPFERENQVLMGAAI